jgi:hypothetical protein
MKFAAVCELEERAVWPSLVPSPCTSMAVPYEEVGLGAEDLVPYYRHDKRGLATKGQPRHAYENPHCCVRLAEKD